VRGFLRGLWKVDLALTLAVVIALCVVEVPRSHPSYSKCCANNAAAQANLQTALTGAETYYASNGHSYVGIDGAPELPAGESSISEIEIGLTFIPGHQSSPAPNIVSIYAHGPSVVVMTAYGKGIQTCWGILRVARSRARPYFPAYPATASVGTFYFHGGSSASSDCMAATVMPTALSTTGFPAA
jgi:hypothetical protein